MKSETKRKEKKRKDPAGSVQYIQSQFKTNLGG